MTADCGSDLFLVYRPILIVSRRGRSRLKYVRIPWVNRYGTAYVHSIDSTLQPFSDFDPRIIPRCSHSLYVQYNRIVPIFVALSTLPSGGRHVCSS